MNPPRRILLVEDEADVAEMLQFFFQPRGYDFLHAADGATALHLIWQRMPHLILLDTILPDTDGIDVCLRLRRTPCTAHIPIIFLTRRSSRHERLTAWAMGADDFIAKPFDPEELLLRVRNSINRVEQSGLVDAPTGLPGPAATRQYLSLARSDPDLAIIELVLHHSAPYQALYGQAALDRVQHALGRLIMRELRPFQTPGGFAGFVENRQLVAIHPVEGVGAFIKRLTQAFNAERERHYPDDDRQRGYLVHEGRRHPLLEMICRVHIGKTHTEV